MPDTLTDLLARFHNLAEMLDAGQPFDKAARIDAFHAIARLAERIAEEMEG